MGLRLGYDVTGPVDAPAVVLGSSLGTTRAMWDDVLAGLARHLRVVRYDHLGHGESAVPPGPYTLDALAGDVIAVMDELGIARAHQGGVSLGGMVAMQIASSYPNRAGRLGLVCTSAYLPPAAMWLERAATVRQYGTPAVVDIITRRWFTPAFAADGRAREMREAFQNVPAEGYASSCEAIAFMDLRPALGAIRSPTLVIAAADDPATPAEHAAVIADAINSGGGIAQLAIVPGAHLAAVEQPAAVARLLLEHWMSLPQTEESHG